MSKKNNKNEKDFLVSTADFVFYGDDVLACTGTTNLNASLEVSTEEQEVKGGKGTIRSTPGAIPACGGAP